MRTIVVNGNIIPGDGEKVIKDASLIIENGMILDILCQPFLPYDTSEEVIDARGGLVIPGIINHHSHGGTTGPFNVFGERPLPLKRVLYNLTRHMLKGTTTIVNACGWPTIEEIEIMNKLHPINLRGSTLHNPIHLKHAQRVDGRGIKGWHKSMTLERMIERGAVAVGEVGAPCVAHGTPHIKEELGIEATVSQIQGLKEAALGPGVDPSAFNEEKVRDALRKSGLDRLLDPQKVKDLMDRHVVKPYEMACDCVEELCKYAARYDIPVLFHNTTDTRELILGQAPKLGKYLIALHCNYTYSPSEAVACARELKKHGAWVDIFTADAYGAQMFHPTPEVTMTLFKEGLVDLISTDYIAGYWDPIPLVVEKAIEAGLIGLPQAVQMMSKRVVDAMPRIGSERGTLAPGKVADVVITDPKRISEVRTVLIGGRRVMDQGRLCV
jgi:cytosine/adenosine deaminase-related metal-dependent hydrolase